MKEALLELNFLRVEFAIRVEPDRDRPGPEGWDHVSMHISMNPGEPLRPLEQIASGGELSRIMLALKTVFAGNVLFNDTATDEIYTGISGQTAWKVSGMSSKPPAISGAWLKPVSCPPPKPELLPPNEPCPPPW